MKKIALHWQILIGMILGVLLGILAIQFGDGGKQFIVDWIKPFGTIFINLLKLIAMPLIIASLIKGVSDLSDISKLANIGLKTISIYVFSTMIAITIGLVIVNVIQPGKTLSETTRAQLISTYGQDAENKKELAKLNQAQGPLQPLVDVIPSNFFAAASNNRNMLQVIFFTVFFGIGMILIPAKQSAPLKKLFESLNEVVLKLIDLIMLAAPYGVLALLAGLIVEAPSTELFLALGMYSFCVVLGLAILVFLVYPTAAKLVAGVSYKTFFNGLSPAQLLAFSTSSSAATLPVTMERVEEHLGVDPDISSFVLPIGATINMDGTSLYQGVAAVFIAQAFGMDLSLGAQLGILITATMASIGSAAVPGAGMIMLAIVLAQAGIPESGLALIFAVDRPLDMCRTVANVSGDATVSIAVATSEGKPLRPKVKEWDDNYVEK